MSGWKQRLFNNWHLMRIVRGAIGVMLLATGIENKDWTISLFSIFFLYQAILDVGCCGSRGCYTPSIRKNGGMAALNEEVNEYEEIK